MQQTIAHSASTGSDARHPEGESRLPAVVSAMLATSFGLLASGLVLAMANLHHAVLQAPLAAAIAIAVFSRLPRHAGLPPLTRILSVTLGIVVVLVVASNLALRSDQVVAGRDGGTYANTSSFLVDGSGLFPAAIADPFTGDDLDFRAPGFVVRPDGTFWQQFLHSTSATYGFFGELFGRGAIFAVNAFFSGLGVLVLFVLAARFMSAWWALLSAGLVATSLPYAYYARGTFSEMATLLLVAGGLWAAHVALTSAPRASLGAGLLMGGAAMVRVDVWMIAIALSLLIFSTAWLGEEEATASAKRIFSGFVIAAGIGLVDLIFFAEPYLNNVGVRFIALIVVAFAIRVALPLAGSEPLRRLASASQRHVVGLGIVVTVALAGFIVYAWLIRPFLSPSRSLTVYGLEAIQLREGSPAEPDRAYSELSVWWLTWYLGVPLVALGFVGFIASARRSLRAGSSGLRLIVLAFAVPTFTYIARPSVNPDQIWAIRRFLPVAIPGLVIFGVAALAWLTALAARRLPDRRLTKPMSGLLVALVAAPLLLASAPLLAESDRAGVEAQFSELCAAFGESSSVVLINDDPELPITWLLGPPLRSWCGLSVAGIAPGAPIPSGVDAVLASEPGLLPNGADFTHELSAKAWEARLTGAPDSTERRSVAVYVEFIDS